MVAVICIIGKTSTGKDTIAKYLESKYGVSPVVSYTTRPARAGETDGKEHFFVSEDTMKCIRDEEDVIAYTKFNDTEYCATLGSLGTDRVKSYIIDPVGYDYLVKNFGTKLNIISLYIKASNKVIIDRALKRGDSTEAVLKRLHNESKMFDDFEKSGVFDYLINSEGSRQDVTAQVDKVMHDSEKLYGRMFSK